MIIDTVAATAGATDLLRPEQVRPWVAYFRTLANDFALAVVLVAHAPKWTGRGEPELRDFYGSVDWGAAVDVAYSFTGIAGQQDTFRVCATKSRWTSAADKLDLTFTIGAGPDGGLVLTSSTARETVEAIILRALDSGQWTRTADVTRAVTDAKYSDKAARDGMRRLLGKRIEDRGEGKARELRLLAEGAT